MLATCGWGGNVALWTADAACKRVWAFRAASERLTGIAWHPHARPQLHSQQPKAAAADGMEGQEGPGAAASETVALATGCADSSAALWSESGKLLRKLEGHTDRLGRVAFHPMGHHLVRGCRKLISRLFCCSRLWCSAKQQAPFQAKSICYACHKASTPAASANTPLPHLCLRRLLLFLLCPLMCCRPQLAMT